MVTRTQARARLAATIQAGAPAPVVEELRRDLRARRTRSHLDRGDHRRLKQRLPGSPCVPSAGPGADRHQIQEPRYPCRQARGLTGVRDG